MSDEATQNSTQNEAEAPVDTAQTAIQTVATTSDILTDVAIVSAASLGDTVVADTGVTGSTELVGSTEAAVVTEPGGPAVIIEPTIGRMVWLRPDAALIAARGINMVDSDPETAQPLSAQIVYVHDSYTVNLAGYDQYGYPFTATRVTLLTGNELTRPEGTYAEWMGYQLAQATKIAA
ncbi:hypothetical protein [Rhodoferax mekongensis]|uniref:Uncharacterized protein n=1 Tax=Rhodoferax mekongensis TaxID=3068341 RepID=A0ABZ0B335_9BURK|nr:hypothetical protein [Rhodoferax sp. TBRC 17307]WNO06035.1 hypothetical protein RAN89_06290 [Rhodoferax sp. TBRC 17307]